MIRIFLSHSSVDKTAVRRLADDLAAAGIDVWLDERRVGIGAPITQRVQEGIASSDYVAVWLTKRAVASKWVQREWGAKLNKEIVDQRIQVLPLLAESCDIPALLVDKRYADFTGSYDDGLDDLLTALGTRRKWTQEALETYVVQHCRSDDFETNGVWRDGRALVVGRGSMDGFRGVFWDIGANTLGVWERGSGSQWYGPYALTERDIEEVVHRLRGTCA